MKAPIEIRYLARNSRTKGYWTGKPAPDSFTGSREDAQPVTAAELAVIRYTFQNVESETVELQNA